MDFNIFTERYEWKNFEVRLIELTKNEIETGVMIKIKLYGCSV